jgi:predicted  nucleic acid-binding Zn-ribbon protein
MEKTCVKCGYTHALEIIDSLTECPKCGVIYAKAEAGADSREQEGEGQAESSSSGGRNFLNVLVLGGLACLIFSYYSGSSPVRKHEKQDENPAVEQKDSLKPANTMQRRPLSGSEVLGRKEKEVEVTGMQNSKVSGSRERPPTIPIEKKPVSYYLAESTISQGENVVLAEHMSEGRYTVFFFYADW